MVEKIIVNPQEVRGLGNILSAKADSDFDLYNSVLSESEDTVYGATKSVFVLESDTTHDYSIAFSSSTYTAVGGSATLEITLLDNNVAVSGATVSVSGSDSSLYTGITNSQGIAEITVSNITGTVTFTASYSNVTDTCSVTAASYLFYDECNSASGLSNYGSSTLVRGSNATITMTYDSSMNAYALDGTGNYHAMIPIPTFNDLDSYTIEADIKTQNNQYNSIGFFIDNRNDTTSYGQSYYLTTYSKEWIRRLYIVSSDGAYNTTRISTLSADNWYHIKLTVDGNSYTGELYDMQGNLLKSDSTSYTINNKALGLFLFCERGTGLSTCWIKNIVAESL